MNSIDRFLNQITLYRVVLYGLIAMAVWAAGLSFFGWLAYTPLQLGISLALLIAACEVSNALLGWLFSAARNVESGVITALILFFIFAPPASMLNALALVLAGVTAMAVKYVLVQHRAHFVNPAAFSAVVVGMVSGTALWWVGAPAMLPITLIVGLAVVRKIRRFDLLIPFLLTSVTIITVHSFVQFNEPVTFGAIFHTVGTIFTSWPIVFLGTIMLTEPLTTPSVHWQRGVYAVIVGALAGLPYQLGPLALTPELALVLGNIIGFVMSPNRRLVLPLAERRQLADGIYEFAFSRPKDFTFSPGQYMEWTLPHERPDSRGNRRYFTIASSPTEPMIRLALKVTGNPLSSFKQALMTARRGHEIIGSRLAGDFTLPMPVQGKFVFVAGGIGVTTFRSMVQYLVDNRVSVDVVLFYTASHPQEFAYTPLFTEAAKVGVITRYVVTDTNNVPANWQGGIGFLTVEQVEDAVPDFLERAYYLSGPNAMVLAYEKLFSRMGVPARQIRTDYFPGY